MPSPGSPPRWKPVAGDFEAPQGLSADTDNGIVGWDDGGTFKAFCIVDSATVGQPTFKLAELGDIEDLVVVSCADQNTAELIADDVNGSYNASTGVYTHKSMAYYLKTEFDNGMYVLSLDTE